MKLKLHIFQNGKNQIFLPRSADSQQIADVAFTVVRKFAPEGQKALKFAKHAGDELTVESVHHWGFVMNGHHYHYGEIYRRIR